MSKHEIYDAEAEIIYNDLLGIFYKLGMLDYYYAHSVKKYLHIRIDKSVFSNHTSNKTDLINKQKTTVE